MGFPVHSVRVQKKSATLWRVRLGHFKTRLQAEEAIVYLDRRKIPHLTIQEEKREQKPVVSKPIEKAPVAKVQAKPEVKAEAKPPVVKKPVEKVEVKKAVATKAPAVKEPVKKTVKTEAKPTAKSVTKPTPAVKTQPVKKTAKSDDPLAATLKAAQAEQKKTAPTDFIAEQIARERKK